MGLAVEVVSKVASSPQTLEVELVELPVDVSEGFERRGVKDNTKDAG